MYVPSMDAAAFEAMRSSNASVVRMIIELVSVAGAVVVAEGFVPSAVFAALRGGPIRHLRDDSCRSVLGMPRPRIFNFNSILSFHSYNVALLFLSVKVDKLWSVCCKIPSVSSVSISVQFHIYFQFSSVQFSTVHIYFQFSSVQFSSVQFSSVQFSTVGSIQFISSPSFPSISLFSFKRGGINQVLSRQFQIEFS